MGTTSLVMALNRGVLATQGWSGWLAEVQPHAAGYPGGVSHPSKFTGSRLPRSISLENCDVDQDNEDIKSGSSDNLGKTHFGTPGQRGEIT